MSDWCFCASDGCDDLWRSAESREDAIAKATASHSAGKTLGIKIGRRRTYTHADLVDLGDLILEALNERACDEAGEAAEDYPDLKAKEFGDALDAFALAWLEVHAPQPRFFQVEDEEEIVPDGRDEA